MSGMENWGKILIFTGLFIAVIGGIISLFGQNLSWLGNLPGDIRIEKDNFKLFFPITTMIIISLVINTGIYLIKLLLRIF